MTLSTTTTRVSYAGNGATTSFAFAFKIWAPSNLKVYSRDNTTLVDTLLTLNVDYTIDIVTYPNTGNVVFVTAPATGKTVVIVRDMPLTQELDLIASGTFAAETIETQLDKLAAEIQTLREMLARSPRLPVGSVLADKEIPNIDAAAVTAGSLLGVNATKDGWSLYAYTLSSVGVTSFGASLVDDTTASAARTTLGLGNIATVGYLVGNATINFGSVADNASSAASNVTVTGAAVGDHVLSVTASGDIATTDGVFLLGKVTATDTVEVTLHNDSNASFDAASQTVYVLVIPKANVGQ